MNSSLKTGLALGALVAVVFVATLISQNVGDQSSNSGDSGEPKLSGPPLYFTHEVIAYDPTSEDMVLRTFQGFYEPGGPKVLVPFWFKNPHPVPVKIVVLGRSCTACSTIRVATFSPEDNRTFEQRIAASSLPASPLGAPSLVTGLSVLAFMESAKKQDFTFESADESIDVPAAVDATTPTWGMLILGIDVLGIGRKDLRADFTFTAGKFPPIHKTFLVGVTGSAPFDVVPKSIKFDDLPEDAEPQTKEVFFWSSTRGMPTPGRDAWPTLPPPTLSLSGTDPFVKIGTPIPVTEAELARSPAQQGQGGAPVRVSSAYRIPVTISRKLPGPQAGTMLEPDIGPYERVIGVTAPGTVVAEMVKVHTTIKGLVALRGESSSVDLGSFTERGYKSPKPEVLVSDRTDLTLEPLKEEAKPNFLHVKLLPKSVEGGRTYWPFEIEIKPGALSGELPLDSVVVFKVTTPTGERKVRVPVKGRAFGR